MDRTRGVDILGSHAGDLSDERADMTSDKTSITRAARTVPGFRQQLIDNLYHIHGQAIQSASQHDAYMALCYTVRDHLIDRWRKTTEAHYAANPKFVYYLSAEYLLGQQLAQNMLYTDTEKLAREALQGTRVSLEDLLDIGRGTGARQWRPGAVGGLLPRFPGNPGHSGGGLRDSLRVRYLPSDVRRRLAGREAGRMAAVRESVGVSPAR